MIDPVSALSSLNPAQFQGAAQGPDAVGFTPLANVPTSPAAVGEGFNNLTQAGAAALNQASAHAAAINAAPLTIGAGGGSPTTWGHMMQQMVLSVNSAQQTAAAKVSDVLQGGPTPVHDAMIASEEASLSFEFLAEMRNKVVDSYNQIMQMQV